MVLCAAILAWKLFLPGFIGMADNGDFPKVAGPLCLASSESEPENFFHPLYLRGEQHCYDPHVPTSEIALAWLASTLEQAVSDPGRFDIRWLGAIHCLLFLGFYYAVLILLRPLSWIARVTLSLMALWIFADIGLLAYLNSFYSDVPAILGGLTTAFLAADLLAAKRLRFGMLLWFSLAALLFITSKAQHGVFGPIPAGLSFFFGWRAPDKRTRIAGNLAGVVLLAATVWILASTPGWYKAQARFNLIFSKIAKNSPSPAGDLAELGLGAEDARYIGLHSYAAGGPMGDPAWAESFRIRSTYGQVLKFYIRHPSRALAILRADLDGESWQRAAGTHFPRQAGRPIRAVSDSLGSWRTLRTWASCVWPWHLVVWFALALPGALLLAIRSASRLRRALGWIILAVSVMAVGEFGIASLADAIETPRHLLMFHVFTDVSIFLGLVFAVGVLEEVCPTSFRRPACAVVAAALLTFVTSIVRSEVFRGAHTADDASPAVIYSGNWSAGAFRGALRGTLTYSDQPGAVARYSFLGTELRYVYTKAFNRGTALVTIDGVVRGTIDLYDPQIVWQAYSLFGGLPQGPHRVEIQVLGQHNPASSGDFIDVDAMMAR